MARPLVEVVWLCRCCGCDSRDAHAEGCRFAPLPELRCDRVVDEATFMRGEHNAHGWESDGRRVFCPGGVQPVVTADV